MLTRYCILDLETVALPDALRWIGKVEAPSNYVKQDAIDNYIRTETEKRLEMAATDAETCMIVMVGLEPWNAGPTVLTILTPDDERKALARVWQTVTATCPMVGYGLTWFDAGVLVRRSQLLGVPVPSAFYKQGKYRHDMIIELADYLTLNGMIEQKKGRGLQYHCERLDLAVADDFTSKDVADLWKEGAYDAIRSHCFADLKRIRLLAERLGVIAPVDVEQITLEETAVL